MRILYVEDEKFLADAVIHLLNKADIDADWASDGKTGLELAQKPIYDALVLDIMLPKMSGIDILRTIRKKGVKTPVIMLSALNEVEDKIKGLESGADDYLAKPFKTAELIARINAITRRPPLKDEHTLSYGKISFDLNNRSINNIMLTEKEALILETLIRNPEKIQKKDYILMHVWGNASINEDNYVEVYISYLRKKLAKIDPAVKIKTIRNLGYKLCSEN